MANQDKDHIPMLSKDIKLQKFTARSASMSMPPNVSSESEDIFVSHTGPLRIPRTQFAHTSGPLYSNQKVDEVPWLKHDKLHAKVHSVMPAVMGQNDWSDNNHVEKNEYLLKSGPLGLCNNPDCTDCPAAYKTKRSYHKSSVLFLDSKLRNILYGEADGWAKKAISCLSSYFPIMNPHTKVVQQWNKFFVISCLIAIFVDPLFFFVLSVQENYKCMVLNRSFATDLAVVRSVTDFIYLLHMLLQFRLAYVAPESRVVGAGDLVDQPKKIALHYLCGYFIFDVFVVLPLPQVMILLVIPEYVGSSAANYAKNLLRATVLLQYAPRIIRFLPLLAGQSASGFIFESAWANFVINLLMFMLASHVVGSSWYLFGLQRVNQCLRDACNSTSVAPICASLIDCGSGNSVELSPQNRQYWVNDPNSSDCFNKDGHFEYGIYQLAVLLTTEKSVVKRYTYSLFWGFQQISTLAGNQVPSYFVWEVLFTMAIIGLGLLLFALLIGNMQNFLQALGRRKLEMQLRRRDVEQWMSHRRLPEDLRRQVRQAERFSWAATRGVNEEQLLENLPEDLQREIRRHFFKFLNKVRIFSLMDEPLFDAVCEKLRQKLYIRGSDILYQGSPVEKMVFIVRGKLESIGTDGNIAPLSEGDVCGEELLTWYLEHSSVNREGGRIRFPGQRLFSNRTVKCLTNVEAFALRAADLEEVTTLFSRFLRHPRVQGAIRYESPYWRNIAATRIQVAWRYRQRRLKRNESSNKGSTHSNSHVWRQYSSDSAS
ncbi:probable cyclic nucleotide-gated ion channel 20, chloroplastic [Elaeis guineensis]|uniref:Probable cyclic nucleotide-gated ion channel 20, chloroplastic n=1 Tax=Elaeis guineensis var. tenera TaxID=51953 RepID=A0A6I9RUI1_ELAGV|nr:probable cyclic nucleotide-gated ion channel 20, chloroplastic [Elaeis guineensis]XP_029122861.1 probable cyclic nucleotide-gated ion channel 20, chloroplastic [Elaeis guineensis]